MNKLQLCAISCVGAVLTSTLLVSPSYAKPSSATNTASSQSSQTTEPNFLQRIEQRIKGQYSNLKQQLENQIQSLSSDFSNGWNGLSQEIQSQIESQIDKHIGALGLPDIVGVGERIEETISSTKADLLQLDPRIQGSNKRQDWNRTYTTNSAQSVLGVEGQKAMKQARETSQQAADIASSSSQAAQNDLVTQDIMKRIAIQNAQTVEVLKLVQASLSEQSQLAATTNINLNDIASNLSAEQRRKQNQEQGTVNAIYRNAAFADGFWSGINGSK